MRLGFVLAALTVAALPASAADSFAPLDEKLGPVAQELAKPLAGTGKVVAVIPFVDDLGGLRRLGVLAAEMLEGKMAAQPDVRLVDRSRIDALLKEKLAWISDLFEDGDPARRAEAAKILKADYLVLGTLRPAGDEVIFTVKVVEVASGTTQAAAPTFSVLKNKAVADLLWYVEPPKKKLERPAELPPIELQFELRAQRRQPDGRVKEGPVKDGDTLRSGDQFQVQFTPLADCWVYVFLVGSSGTCETLFPYKGVKLGNLVRGGAAYAVPDPDAEGGSRWFWLDAKPGTETLYIVAAYEPMTEIGKVLEEMSKGGATREGPSPELQKAVEDVKGRSEASLEKSAGLKVRDGPADTDSKAREVLRGRVSVVKEIRLNHR